MRPIQLMLIFLLVLPILYSCGGGGGGGGSKGRGNTGPERQEDPGEIVYDNELSSTEKRELETSIETMAALDIDGTEIRGFPEVFNGTNSAAVVDYLKLRINYFLSSSTVFEDRIVIAGQPAVFRSALVDAVTLATNPSVLLWYFAKINEPTSVQYQINNELISIPSSRVGIVQLGEAFVIQNTIQQATTLVHEARHSDCTGGALATDLQRFENGQIPLNHFCGHTHEVCPPGHELEGEFACDAHPWGAYIVGAIYAAAIALECSSCTEAHKSVAEVVFLDSVSRPLYDVAELLNGRFGPPDMSSSNQVR